MDGLSRSWLVAICSAAYLTVAPTVSAQDSAAAEALFDKALADMEAGDYDGACPTFSESYRIDPRAGTLFTMAECERRWGKVASASSHYQDYLRLFEQMTGQEQRRQRGRDKYARQFIEELTPQIPKLTVRLPDGASDVVEVRRDSVVLGKPSLGVPLPVDPGDHLLVVTLADGSKSHQTVSITPGESKEVVLDLPASQSDPDVQPSAPSPIVPREVDDDPIADEAPPRSRHTGAFIAGGVGVLGLVVGGTTGAMVFGKKSAIDEHCDTDGYCDAEGKKAYDGAKTLGSMSNVGFALGGVGIATSVVLFAVRKKSSSARRFSPEVMAGRDHTMVGLRGKF